MKRLAAYLMLAALAIGCGPDAQVPAATLVPATAVAPAPSPTLPPARDVAPLATAEASDGADAVRAAVDEDGSTLWSAGGPPPQWYRLAFDRPYRVERVELVVAQNPAGPTIHQLWLEDAAGTQALHHTFAADTTEGQTLVFIPDPPVVARGLTVRTVQGPSFVAWHNVRIFGRPPPAGAEGAVGGGAAGWPEVALSGGLDRPVRVVGAGDGSGRLFVLEQAGRVRVLDRGALRPAPFLDLTDRVSCCGERGLLGLAFPPGGSAERVYAAYTAKDGAVVLSRFRVAGGSADAGSEEVLLAVAHPDEVHNGGALAFGPRDGYLYVGVGDGAQEGTDSAAQDPGSLLGKILRLDVEGGAAPYAVPPTNPFAGMAGRRPEVWALGLRNPWALAFDRRTGDLYVADVGAGAQEEIDVQPVASRGGENYGWPLAEGLECRVPGRCNDPALVAPVAAYRHDQGCAVVGGAVYRGARSPALDGIYVYADYCSGRIWGLRNDTGGWRTALLTRAPFLVAAVGEDDDGELLVVDYTHGGLLGLAEVASSGP